MSSNAKKPTNKLGANLLESELHQTRAKLAELSAVVNQRSGQAEAAIKSLWQTAGERLEGMELRLKEAAEKLTHSGEEANLQAHLALMDVKMAWTSLSEVMESVASDSVRGANQQLDHAAVKVHLGKLEVVDYLQGPGRELIRRFQRGRQQVEQETLSMVHEMGKHMGDIALHMRRDV